MSWSNLPDREKKCSDGDAPKGRGGEKLLTSNKETHKDLDWGNEPHTTSVTNWGCEGLDEDYESM